MLTDGADAVRCGHGDPPPLLGQGRGVAGGEAGVPRAGQEAEVGGGLGRHAGPQGVAAGGRTRHPVSLIVAYIFTCLIFNFLCTYTKHDH